MTNPVEALTRAFLEADGFDPDTEIQADSGLARHYFKVANVAVETLKGIGWGEVERFELAPGHTIHQIEPGEGNTGTLVQPGEPLYRRRQVDA